MNGAGSVANRLAPLSERLTLIRQSDRDRYGRFFAALGARMEGARAVERELDRLLARNFNALDYLRTDELGLSRIVGDLLDPGGTHGQGTCFLARFGDLVGSDRWPASQAVRYDDFDVNVLRERRTDGGGRLDISVELRSRGREPACIAFEKQALCGGRRGSGRGLSRVPETSLWWAVSPDIYDRTWRCALRTESSRAVCKDGLAIMSFCPRDETGEYDESFPLRLPFSLSDWLRECRHICDAERLRWFLSEVETFCHKTFGGIVTTTSERKEVRDFILASDDNVLTALSD